MTILTTPKGDKYEAVRLLKRGRAIVNMEGAFVMMECRPDGLWEEGGPARPGEELDALNALVKEGTTVKVTKPDGSTETFEDK